MVRTSVVHIDMPFTGGSEGGTGGGGGGEGGRGGHNVSGLSSFRKSSFT